MAEVEGRGANSAGDSAISPPASSIFQVIGDKPAKLLVIYTPPYEENPDRVIR